MIYVFCTNCKREIVFVLICRTSRTISVWQLLITTLKSRKKCVKFWLNWRNYGSVLYSFSCTNLSTNHNTAQSNLMKYLLMVVISSCDRRTVQLCDGRKLNDQYLWLGTSNSNPHLGKKCRPQLCEKQCHKNKRPLIWNWTEDHKLAKSPLKSKKPFF